MKQLVWLAGVLLAASTAAGQPGHFDTSSGPATIGSDVGVGHKASNSICETRTRHRPAPKLEVTITPSMIKIPDNSKRGMPLARVTVRWSNGEPFRGEVRLTKNTAGICQLTGMELKLSRDVTKADDYKRSECTVTAIR